MEDEWTPPQSMEMPSKVVRFHKVEEDGKVIDTLAVLEDGQTVSLSVLFGDVPGKAS